MVQNICQEAYSTIQSRQQTRYIRRLTPITHVHKTLGKGLEQLCNIVLRPVFEADKGGDAGKKVRTTSGTLCMNLPSSFPSNPGR